MRYGNDTETFYTYEPERRRLKNMIAETAANRKMMDNVYTYDKVSNILNLKNNAPIPTSNLMGSQTDYSFVYDDLYRLTSATGSNKGSNHEDMYTLKMAYNSVHGIVKKEQLHQFKSPNATNWSPRNKTTYTYNYQYGTAQPHAPIKIGNYSYTYDANGNQTGWDDNNSGQQRQILWDEENRIKAIEDNGALFSYVYDAGGERVLKSNGGGAQVSVNGSPKGGNGSIGNYTVYVNPYVVIRNGGATKHFYIESQRIATKILESKDGLLQNVTTTSTAPAGNRTVDYAKKQKLLENDLNLILAKVDGEAGNSGQTPPNGNAYGWGNGNNGGMNNGNGGTNGNGNNGGTNNGGTNNGGGSNGGGNNGGGTGTGGNNGGGNTGGGNGNNVEKFVFYYHPDHLGSSSYITDVNGEVSQHIEYFAFGETFVEEHSNTGATPYKFNAKELDDETGLYYYGARYYDPKTNVWQSVDPLAGYNPILEVEHYIDGQHNGGIQNSGNNNPYIYTYQNPILYVDPNGKQNVFFETRSFAPFPSFGKLPYPKILRGHTPIFTIGEVGPFLGDTRKNATTSPSATSRISGKLDINLQSGKKISSSTGVYTSYSFQTGESVKATSKLESESFNFFGYIDIGMHNFGHNKLVFGSPDIDVNVDAQIYKLNNGVFNIKGKVSGDAFPSQELIFGDNFGNRIMLSNFDTKGDRNMGPLIMLPGNFGRVMGQFDINVQFDKNGKLINATNNKTNESIKIDNYKN